MAGKNFLGGNTFCSATCGVSQRTWAAWKKARAEQWTINVFHFFYGIPFLCSLLLTLQLRKYPSYSSGSPGVQALQLEVDKLLGKGVVEIVHNHISCFLWEAIPGGESNRWVETPHQSITIQLLFSPFEVQDRGDHVRPGIHSEGRRCILDIPEGGVLSIFHPTSKTIPSFCGERVIHLFEALCFALSSVPQVHQCVCPSIGVGKEAYDWLIITDSLPLLCLLEHCWYSRSCAKTYLPPPSLPGRYFDARWWWGGGGGHCLL